MRYRFRLFFASLVSLMLILFIFVSCIEFYCFNRSFYSYEYASLDLADEIGMSESDLYESIDVLLDYLEGHREDIVLTVMVEGEIREVFNERETLHMADVLTLYEGVKVLKYVCLGMAIFLLAFLYYDNKHELGEAMAVAYQKMAILFTFILCALLILAYSDFDSFWTTFHEIFFDNDLWLLNPNTSIMINMLPDTVFYHLVILIGVSFVVILVVLFIVSQKYLKKLEKRLKDA